MKPHELREHHTHLISDRAATRNALRRERGRVKRLLLKIEVWLIQRQIDSTLEQLAEARAKAEREIAK